VGENDFMAATSGICLVKTAELGGCGVVGMSKSDLWRRPGELFPGPWFISFQFHLAHGMWQNLISNKGRLDEKSGDSGRKFQSRGTLE
jgi:hypothetical protein